MKQIFLRVCLQVGVFFIVLSCQKEKEMQPALTSSSESVLTVSEAQSWFLQNLSHSKAKLSDSSRTKKEPIWDKATQQQLPVGLAIVVPLKYSNGGVGYGGTTNLVLHKDDHGGIQTQIIKAVGTSAYIGKKNYGIDRSDFTGVLMYFNWNEEPIKGYQVDNGKVISQIDPKGTNNPTARTQYYCGYLQIDNYVQACYSSGEGIETCLPKRYQSSTYYPIVCTDPAMTGIYDGVDYSQGYSMPSSPPPGEDGPHPTLDDPAMTGQYSQFVASNKVVNQLTDPCQQAVLQMLVQKGLKAEVNKILRDVFNVNDEVDITFRDVPSLPNTTDGQISPTSTGTYFERLNMVTADIIVDINNVALANATKEYLAATFLHEAIHAYIDYRNLVVQAGGYSNAVIRLDQHDVMAAAYVNQLKDAVLEIFPSYPPDYAEALAWGGLHESAAWSTKPPAWQQAILDKNHVEKGLTGVGTQVGTGCP